MLARLLVQPAIIIEGGLEVKLPTVCTDEKQRWEEPEKRREEKRREEKRREEERRGEERRGEERRGEERRERRRRRRRRSKTGSQKKEDAGARKVGKSRNTAFFSMICGSGGSKSRLAKAAGAQPSGQMRDEKLHSSVVRSTILSQNAQNTPGPDHFWQLRCRKSARHCSAKHVSKSKCRKRTRFGALFEVEMSKKVHAVAARSTFPSEKKNASCSEHFWEFRCRKSARRCGAKHTSSQKCKKLTGSEHLLTFRCRFAWQGQRILHVAKTEQNAKVL